MSCRNRRRHEPRRRPAARRWTSSRRRKPMRRRHKSATWRAWGRWRRHQSASGHRRHCFRHGPSVP
ncbi:hypothetical protein CEJ86_29030 [Sinorhizobium meliloti]|uniref:Uncharacterized protein n=1 Tax=Rhizobium meliloti TaxID=382 RepID=A0A2J0YUU9_RHIML|nr:hypothetical protein CEJ86_29030 [Sinorhizobium meliloti]